MMRNTVPVCPSPTNFTRSPMSRYCPKASLYGVSIDTPLLGGEQACFVLARFQRETAASAPFCLVRVPVLCGRCFLRKHLLFVCVLL